MSAQVQTSYLSPQEYLTRERRAQYKSEYFEGEIFAMAGASPDIVALCGSPCVDDEPKDTLLNPTVIIEVLSESTQAYDPMPLS